MEYNTSMNRRELLHTIQLFSLRSLSEAIENSPTPLVDSYPDNVSLRRRHRWALQVTLPQTSISKQNSPSLKHTYTHKERERGTERQTEPRQRQRDRDQTERETEMKNLRKTYPKLLTLKHVFTEELPFFSPWILSVYTNHISKQKSPGC